MEIKTAVKTRTAPARPDVDARTKCRTAKQWADLGEYEAAREALSGLWNGIGQAPNIEGLSPDDRAEVFLRVGALSGFLGSSAQVPGAQEFAKDLITKSIRAYEGLGNGNSVAEAQNDLAICYWREGAMDEARVWFREAINGATDPAIQLRILVNSTIVEVSSGRLQDALSLLERAAPLLEVVRDDAAMGKFHMQRALVYKEMGGAENYDRALIDNTAARIHFEHSNHRRYFARVENNTGFLLLLLGRHEEALEHLESARATFGELGDVGTAAQVNETRARVFLAQRRYADAEKIAFAAASVLETGGEYSLLAEALETQATALARMGRHQSALGLLKRSAHIAETAGDLHIAGRMYVTVLEELKSFLSAAEIGEVYREADERLGNQLDQETGARLRACARFVIAHAGVTNTGTASISGSFEEEVHKRESELIRNALDESRGSVTRAARILGLTHQGLCYIINHRHQQLLTARAPIRIRRKSLIKKK
ncbi:MAG: helix-turn-helix domain-containing protein [Acidobacteriota bacterium]